MTHGYVVAESIAVARRRLGVDGVIALLDDVLPAIELLPVDAPTHAAAQARYRASLPSGVSFVDHVSLAVIERDGIGTALVLDSDFDRRGCAAGCSDLVSARRLRLASMPIADSRPRPDSASRRDQSC